MTYHVLFVCVRNRVRSIFAQYYLEKLLKDTDEKLAEEIKITSAGFYPGMLSDALDEAHIPRPDPFFGIDMSQVVRRALAQKGLTSLGEWRSRPITPEEIAEADLIIVALQAQKEEISEQNPHACNKIFTFREMAEFEETILFESWSGVPMDDTFWEYCEEDPPYVTKVIEEVEELLIRGFPNILKKLGVQQSDRARSEPDVNR
jgi:protein-tyrosine-phosphatase